MKRILVVDDSPIDQKLVASLLEKRCAGRDEPLSVTCAGDGQQALQAMARELPDLIITDLQMPNVNGLQLVEQVRTAHPSLPVVLMTAYGSEDIAVQALERGAASYVPKRRLAADLVDTAVNILEMIDARREQRRVIDQYWLHSESHFQIPNNLANIPPLIGHLQDNLSRLRACDEHEQIRLAVALREALSNAIVHGNLEISSAMRQADDRDYYRLIEQRRHVEPYRSRFVTVIAEEAHSEAVYVVRDEGPGFDASNIPDPTEPENLEKVSGRGLLLIQTFMDDVQFNPTGNEITMIKRRDR